MMPSGFYHDIFLVTR